MYLIVCYDVTCVFIMLAPLSVCFAKIFIVYANATTYRNVLVRKSGAMIAKSNLHTYVHNNLRNDTKPTTLLLLLWIEARFRCADYKLKCNVIDRKCKSSICIRIIRYEPVTERIISFNWVHYLLEPGHSIVTTCAESQMISLEPL